MTSKLFLPPRCHHRHRNHGPRGGIAERLEKVEGRQSVRADSSVIGFHLNWGDLQLRASATSTTTLYSHDVGKAEGLTEREL